jgi:hypothetical protein
MRSIVWTYALFPIESNDDRQYCMGSGIMSDRTSDRQLDSGNRHPFKYFPGDGMAIY